MSADGLRCRGCGERDELFLLDYEPPQVEVVTIAAWPKSMKRNRTVAAVADFQCLKCDAREQVETPPLSEILLAKYHYEP